MRLVFCWLGSSRCSRGRQSASAQDPAAAPPRRGGSRRCSAAEELEQIVAPIALYPDSLLAQVFMASTYPLEIVEAARWAKANPELKDNALEDALQAQTWDPSVKSLTAFPQVLTMMNEKLDWTQKLGDAFLAQQERRDGRRAAAARQGAGGGQSRVERAAEGDRRAAAARSGSGDTDDRQIEPANPQVVYVPTYNPTVVYGAWPYPRVSAVLLLPARLRRRDVA